MTNPLDLPAILARAEQAKALADKGAPGVEWADFVAFTAWARTSVPAICADIASLVERVRELEHH
jgi:hypothetical protein